MNSRNAAIGGLIFAVGLVAGLIGYITDLYSAGLATVLMLGIWAVGGLMAGFMSGSNRAAVGGLVGAVGLGAGLLGYVGKVYSATVATVLMLGIWIIGGAIVRLVFSGKKD
ncbi:MAG TPA: hypothetical protein VMY98_01260 [Anaerolineae bacterium]|nr:hypothetical protein [Anaerolineae bacterium]